MDAKDKMLQELTELMARGETIEKKTTSAQGFEICNLADFYGWTSDILTTLNLFHLENLIYYKKIHEIEDGYRVICPEHVDTILSQLKSLRSQIQKDLVQLGEVNTKSSLSELENIFDKFYRVARQLRTRHDNRATLTIKDEYDVQDLLHALLRLHFEDVKPEEWTPSYAGGCERMDFLLRDLKTVIEVKKTRETMTQKQLGEELIIDIEKYKTHPDCKFIYCFVYDPDGYLGNPAAIKNDLEKAHDGFVKIFIRPNL